MKNQIGLLLFCVSFLLSTAYAAEPIAICPDETDTQTVISYDLAAVMRAYRTHLNDADPIVAESARQNKEMRLQIPQAIEKIQKAVDCASYVYRNYNGSMMASSILDHPESERPKYLELYREMTLTFLNLLKTYRDLLVVEWQKSAVQQNYEPAAAHALKVREFGNQAHRKF